MGQKFYGHKFVRRPKSFMLIQSNTASGLYLMKGRLLSVFFVFPNLVFVRPLNFSNDCLVFISKIHLTDRDWLSPVLLRLSIVSGNIFFPKRKLSVYICNISVGLPRSIRGARDGSWVYHEPLNVPMRQSCFSFKLKVAGPQYATNVVFHAQSDENL